MKTVILAAGFGSRLWPVSTPEQPKQFVSLIGQAYMLQYTYELYSRQIPSSELYVLTLATLESLIDSRLPDLPKSQIITVPARRNILPHTLFALNWLNATPDEPVMFVGCDYTIAGEAVFDTSLAKFITWCGTTTTDTLLLCDTKKPKEAQGYVTIDKQDYVQGYVDKESQTTTDHRWYHFPHIYVVSKTSLGTALTTIEDKALAEQAQKLLTSSKKLLNSRHKNMPFIGSIFAFSTADGSYRCTPNTKAYPAKLGMTDMGTFAAVYDATAKDDHGNALIGDNILVDKTSAHNLLINFMDKPMAVINTTNMAVIYTSEGCLTCPLRDADKIGPMYKEHFKLPR
jgi:mannose-1-phosphate guanylyltransferase